MESSQDFPRAAVFTLSEWLSDSEMPWIWSLLAWFYFACTYVHLVIHSIAMVGTLETVLFVSYTICFVSQLHYLKHLELLSGLAELSILVEVLVAKKQPGS